MDKSFIEIVFNESIRSHLRICGWSGDNIIVFPMKLHFGNICNVNNFEARKADYQSLFFYFDDLDDCIYEKKAYESLSILINEERKIRIWAGQRDSEELCGLYFLCHFLNEKDLYLVNIPIDKSCDIERYDTFTYTSEFLDIENIPYIKIDDHKKNKFKGKWNQLKNINSDLRVYMNGEICSVNYGDVLNIIFNSLDNEEDMMQLIGRNQDYNDAKLDYYQLLALVNYMIKANLIKITKKIIKNELYGEYSIYIEKNEGKYN